MKEWHIDPLMEQAQEWRLWIWEHRTLAEVEWDLGEWRWPPLDSAENPALLPALGSESSVALLAPMWLFVHSHMIMP